MTSAVLIGGIRGSGKSATLICNEHRAIVIAAEAVQAKAIEIALGSGHDKRYDWDIWDQNLQERAIELLGAALKCRYPNLQHAGKPFLIEGSFSVNDWFRKSLLCAISNHFSVSIDKIYGCIFHYEAEVISNQIEARGRNIELCYVNDFRKIKEERDGYSGISENSDIDWIKITSSEDLHRFLEIRL